MEQVSFIHIVDLWTYATTLNTILLIDTLPT